MIQKLYIGHFGKFHDFSMEFKEGYQVIQGENEFGKSTLMAFIQLMFYGKTSSKRVFYENLRKKYEPWSHEVMSGWLEFMWNGEVYHLEKQFGKSVHTDTVKLYRLSDGKEIDLQGREVGEYVFSLDKTAFERMFFVYDNQVFSDKKTSEYAFSQLWTEAAGVDTDCYTEAVRKLEQGKEEILSKSGKKGSLVAVQDELKLLSKKQMEADKKYKERERIGKERAKLMNYIQELEEQLEVYYEATKQAGKKEKIMIKVLLLLAIVGLLIAGFVLKKFEFYIVASGCLIILWAINRFLKRKKEEKNEDSLRDGGKTDEMQKEFTAIRQMLEMQRKLLEDLSCLEESLSNEEQIESPKQLRFHKQQLKEKEIQLQQKYRAYQYALDTLQETKEELQKACSPALNERVGFYLKKLTNEKYTAVFVKEGFDIVLFDSVSQQYHPWQYFSQSTKEVLYLSLRLALVDILMKKESVPLFLDDLLISFDAERKERALRLFQEYGLSHQVILFACR